MLPILHSNFVTPILPNYERNNKSTGHKSLRCFPSCRMNGHVIRGFCGQTLIVQFTVSHENGLAIEQNPLMVVAEIHSTNVIGLGSCQNNKKSPIAPDAIYSNLRCNNNVNRNPLFSGGIDFIRHTNRHTSLIQCSFNSSADSWNYGWASNRWNTESHVVDIVLFGEVKDCSKYSLISPEALDPLISNNPLFSDYYYPIGVFSSNEFTISCTKDTQHNAMQRAANKKEILENRYEKMAKLENKKRKMMSISDVNNHHHSSNNNSYSTNIHGDDSFSVPVPSSLHNLGLDINLNLTLPGSGTNSDLGAGSTGSTGSDGGICVVGNTNSNSCSVDLDQLTSQQQHQLYILQQLQQRVLEGQVVLNLNANKLNSKVSNWDKIKNTNKSKTAETAKTAATAVTTVHSDSHSNLTRNSDSNSNSDISTFNNISKYIHIDEHKSEHKSESESESDRCSTTANVPSSANASVHSMGFSTNTNTNATITNDKLDDTIDATAINTNINTNINIDESDLDATSSLLMMAKSPAMGLDLGLVVGLNNATTAATTNTTTNTVSNTNNPEEEGLNSLLIVKPSSFEFDHKRRNKQQQLKQRMLPQLQSTTVENYSSNTSSNIIISNSSSGIIANPNMCLHAKATNTSNTNKIDINKISILTNENNTNITKMFPYTATSMTTGTIGGGGGGGGGGVRMGIGGRSSVDCEDSEIQGILV